MFAFFAAAMALSLEGRIEPPSPAAVSIHAAERPWTNSALTGADGRFRFRGLSAGSYTLTVFIPRKGEVRRTVTVGPALADNKGRVRVTVDLSQANLNRDAANLVSSRELSIPQSARRAYAEAERKLRRHDVEGAIALLRKAVEMAPEFAAAWNHLGTIAYQTGRYEEAEGHFRRALEADPGLYEPLVNLGGVLVTRGALDEAWKVNVEAVLARPTDALAHSQLGLTYLATGRLELAEKHLLEAIRLDPAHFSHPQLQLAEVYARRNDRQRAAQQLEEFLRLHPDHPRSAAVRQMLSKWR